jgi:hypothetical protein
MEFIAMLSKIILFSLTIMMGVAFGYAMSGYSQEGRGPPMKEGAERLFIGKIEKRLDELFSKIEQNKRSMEIINGQNRTAIAALKQKVDSLNESQFVNDGFIESEEEVLVSADKTTNEFEQMIQKEQIAFENEEIDINWASKAESDLVTGLNDLMQQFEFEIVSSECRTTRCNAAVSFENYELAKNYGGRLAEFTIPGLNCAQSIYLPPPLDTSVRYQANLLLDCSQLVQENMY